MQQQIDVLSIGDVVTDNFIKLMPHEAEIEDDKQTHHPLLCMTYGTKIPFESSTVINGVGNSPNAAVCFAKLGLNSALYVNIGDDKVGEDTLLALKHHKVSTEFVHVNAGMVSNYHYVLWYGADRTILIKHQPYPYKMPRISDYQKPRWIYLSSLGENGMHLHAEIANYLEKNPDIKLAFQPGTFQIREGVKKLSRVYKRTEVYAVNLEEAQIVTGLNTREVPKLIAALHKLGPKIVVVTDGPNGSFASDGQHMWSMGTYPDPKPPIERTGAGDAFTSTFVAALVMGQDIQTALMWAPINPMGVVQQIGAQAGLFTKAQIKHFLDHAPKSYVPKEIKA